MRRFREHKYFHLGVMVLGVVVISLALLAVVLNLDAVGEILSQIADVFSPIAIGLVLAYLLNPMMKFFDKLLQPLLIKWKMKPATAKKTSKAVSLILSLIVFGMLVYGFLAMLLPQLYLSISGIVSDFSKYYTVTEQWVSSFLADNPTVQKYAIEFINSGFSMLKDWTSSGILPSIETIVSGLTSSVINLVGGIMDLLIGLCAAVYMLASKEKFLAQGKKIVVALCRDSLADRILALGRKVNKVFSGFIIGKILDSMIIGVLCYIGMLILRLPYPALIATVVGVTNVIPFFGPFIGAIPSGLLILLVNPMQALYFGIFILALQQLDGNVIGPYILGDSIGISGFWVLVSITVAGGLFGFSGMLLGVPVFAVLYTIAKDMIANRLKKKDHTVETEAYYGIKRVDDLGDTSTEKETT